MKNIFTYLLDRARKKPPFKDGRKIGLCLPGGMMTGVRGAGAMIALEDLGLSEAFDEICVASAGFPNGLYFKSKEARKGTSIYLEELSGRKFIDWSNLLKMKHPIKVEAVLNAILGSKHVNLKNLFSSPAPLFVRLKHGNSAVYVNAHSYKERLAPLLRSSISVPFLMKPPLPIGDKSYYDGQLGVMDMAEHLKFALHESMMDVLVVYNHSGQRTSVFSERLTEILPPRTRLSLFETQSSVLKEAAEEMTYQVKKEFTLG